VITSALRCPLCAGAFVFEPRSWACTQGHRFDVAREGYVNLLPVQHKASRDPGDTEHAVQARRAFLDAGHYQPLRDALVDAVRALAPQVLVDVGCGEGYYTGGLRGTARELIGLDIAKPAVRLAAKRHPGISWVVGSGARLPLADASVDALCSLFTPVHEPEMARVLKPGGSVLLVTPGAMHLGSLREALFETVQAHEPDKFRRGFEADFDLAAQHTLAVPLILDSENLRRLVAMTPYAWKAKPERRAALDAREGLQTEAQFAIQRFTRR
jgi:23S rRNA (guanine745-N1)-methyltransferase